MQVSNKAVLHTQRGVSLSGLIFVLALAMVVAMLALKVIPSILEFRAAKAAILASKSTDGSVSAVRTAFDKSADINDITVITGNDLQITKVNGQTEVSFAYRKEIPLFTNV